MNYQDAPRERRPPQQAPESKGYSPAAFIIVLIIAILMTIFLVIALVLYFRKNASQIDPAECPELITGVLAQPDTEVSTPATNCGSNLDCTYEVGSLSEAVSTCATLGTSKCVKFSLDGTQMTVSSLGATTTAPGKNTYRIVQ